MHLLKFMHAFADKALAEIRYASQKGWVLGSERFKQQIAQQLNRRVSPSRKSPKQDN